MYLCVFIYNINIIGDNPRHKLSYIFIYYSESIGVICW